MTAILFCLLAADPGSAAMLRGEWQEAVDAITVEIGEKPTAKLYINRGSAYGKLGNAREALIDFNEAVRLDPKEPAAYSNRANLLERAGYHEHALADGDRSLKLRSRRVLQLSTLAAVAPRTNE